MALVVNGGEVSEKDGINSVDNGDDVQASGLDGATLREKELSSCGSDAYCAGGVPPLSGPEDSKDVISASLVLVMVVVVGGRGLGGGGSVAN